MAKQYKKFHHGKNLSKTDKSSIPLKGEPNTYIDSYHKKTGKFASRRKINGQGNAYVDLDVADHHKNYDHAHDLVKKETFHDKDRPLTPKERKELKKAKRKRRFM